MGRREEEHGEDEGEGERERQRSPIHCFTAQIVITTEWVRVQDARN